MQISSPLLKLLFLRLVRPHKGTCHAVGNGNPNCCKLNFDELYDCSASKAGRCVAVVAALSAAVRWLQKWQWWRPTTGVAGHSRTVSLECLLMASGMG